MSNKQHKFHLAFKAVNSGVNKLVVGVAHDAPRSDKVQGKAISVPFNKKSTDDNPYDARMDAIEQLFEKIRCGNDITIYTDDEKLHQLSRGDECVPETARERFNALAEKFGNDDDFNEHFLVLRPQQGQESIPIKKGTIQIQGYDPTACDPPPKKTTRGPMALAAYHMQLHINKLIAPNRG